MTLERKRYDAIVVGSGPGGATVARELSRGAQRVLVLEWGEQRPVTGSFGQMFRELFLPGRSLLLTYGPLGIVRGITVGGSSLWFTGTAWEPPFEMLERHGIDIRHETAEAHGELPMAPLAPELIGPRATRIMESARGLGLDWKPLDKFHYQDRCSSRDPMGMYNAPSYDAKWSARMWIDEAVECGAELRTGAKVHQVLVENSTAKGVVFECARRRYEAYADTIVLAAGGIGSPTILRASGIARAGHDFFFDPIVLALGELDGFDEGPEMAMCTGAHCADDGYMITDMVYSRFVYQFLTAQVGRFGKLGAYRRTLGIMVKAKDELGGHLTDRGGVRKALSPADRAKLAHGYERAKSILTHAGAKGVYRSGYIASHPGGTVKVGDLLDENLQTQFENLYVCDCSAIPEAWGLPPTLTLIGLGKRLARHLLGAAGRFEATEAAAARS